MSKCANHQANASLRLICRSIVILFSTIVAACSNSEQTGLAPNNSIQIETVKIVALGDSTTEAGWEGNARVVYAERLIRDLEAEGIDATIVNAGISNTTSRQALARLDDDVRRHNPDFVIVQFGINDSWIDANQGRTEPRLSLEEYTDRLNAIIDILSNDGAKVILMTPNPMRWSEMYGEELRKPALKFDFDDPRGINRLLDVYAKRVRDIALERNVPLIDVSANFEEYDKVDGQSIHELLIPGDEMHPNDAGHALISQWLAAELVQQLRNPSEYGRN
jgi:lysophospholipase L1-like esterase